MYEIKLFLGIATADKGNELGYPDGEKHAFLIFSRQPKGSEPDWALAESHIRNGGWSVVELQKASTVDASVLDANDTARPSYDDAMAQGSSILVYSDPV